MEKDSAFLYVFLSCFDFLSLPEHIIISKFNSYICGSAITVLQVKNDILEVQICCV